MRLGLHMLASPVNQYPDGSLHPPSYDWSLFQVEYVRSPELIGEAARTAWVNAVSSRKAILIVDPAEDPATVLQLYGNKLVAVEIGNECSDTGPWKNDAAEYPKRYLAWRQAAKAYPVRVITCGLQGTQNCGHACKWLSRMLDAIPQPWVDIDVVGVHLYPSSVLEMDRIPEMLDNLRRAMWSYRCEERPVWCTETGVLKPRFRSQPRYVQHAWSSRMLRHARDGGCEVAVWYAADQHDMGFGTKAAEIEESVALWSALISEIAALP